MTLEKSWKSCKIHNDWKRRYSVCFQNVKKGGPWELPTLQPHLSVWEYDGTDSPRSCEKKRIYLRQTAKLHQEQVPFNQPNDLLWGVTSSGTKEELASFIL